MKLTTTLSVLVASAATVCAVSLRGVDGLGIDRRHGEHHTHHGEGSHPNHPGGHAWPSTRTAPNHPAETTPLSAAAGAVGAIGAPMHVDGSTSFPSSGNNSAASNLTLHGFGGSGSFAGPGSAASGAGSAAAAGNHTKHGEWQWGFYNVSANAASAAAITNPHATNVTLTTISHANATTFEGPHGLVTIAYAESRSIATSLQGDHAEYWAHVTSSSGPWAGDNWIHGHHGGSHKGQAYGNAEYGKFSVEAAAGNSSVYLSVTDPGPPYVTSSLPPQPNPPVSGDATPDDDGVNISLASGVGVPSNYTGFGFQLSYGPGPVSTNATITPNNIAIIND